jgi:hypothetical protein
MFKIELGSEVKSNITGFKGIVVSRAEHLNGCNKYIVQPEMKKNDDKYPESYWLDEQEIIVIKEPKIKKDKEDKRGGQPVKAQSNKA